MKSYKTIKNPVLFFMTKTNKMHWREKSVVLEYRNSENQKTVELMLIVN